MGVKIKWICGEMWLEFWGGKWLNHSSLQRYMKTTSITMHLAEWRFGLKLWNDPDGRLRYIMLSIRACKASVEAFLDTNGVWTRSSMSN